MTTNKSMRDRDITVSEPSNSEKFLAPLQALGTRASSDYEKQQRELETVHRKFRSVESFYASSFSRVLELEKQVSGVLSQWKQQDTPVQGELEQNSETASNQ